MKEKGKKRFSTSLLIAILAIVLACGMMPVNSYTVHAESGPDKTVTDLGVSPLRNPNLGNGGWCKMYYLSASTPLRFKVLNIHETRFGGETLLLDCDSIIGRTHGANSWDYHWTVGSQVRNWLAFHGEDRATDAEIGTMHRSYKSEPAEGDVYPVYDPQGILDYEFDRMEGSKLFVLDAAEAMNVHYGFPSNRNATSLRKKDGGDYWLRSKSGHWSQADSVALVNSNGSLSKKWAIDRDDHDPKYQSGVSPAVNIPLNKILFTTLIKGVVRMPDSEYKMTLIDDSAYPYISGQGLAMKAGQITRHGNEIRVPFNVSGIRVTGVNRISYLVTDKAWNAEGAKIIKYGKLDITSGNVTSEGEGSFDLPDDYDQKNTDHHVYVFAEVVNGEKKSDYASRPAELDVPPANIKVEVTPYEGVYDGESHGIKVKVQPGNTKVKYGTTEGTYDLDQPPVYTDAGEYTVYYQAAAEDYEPVEGSATIRIAPRPVTVNGMEVSDRVYDGTTEAKVDTSRAYIDNVLDNEYLDIAATGVFRDPNVGVDKTVSLSYTLTGRDGTNADNYVLDTNRSQIETSASITKRTVTVDGITGVDKVDDDYLNVDLNYDEVVIDDMIEGDDLGVTAAGNLGMDYQTLVPETVFIHHMKLTGSDKDNYQLDSENSQKKTTVTIWPNGYLFVKVSEKTHVYDGKPHTINVSATDTVEDSDPSKIRIQYRAPESETWQTEAITATDVGTTTIYYRVVDDNIYDSTINTVEGSATLKITPKPVSVSGAEGLTKVYDGTNNVSDDFDFSSADIKGKVDGDDIYVKGGSAVYTDAKAGENKILLSGLTLGGENAGNYILEPSAQIMGTITKRPITVSGIEASDKVYDGTTDAKLREDKKRVQNVIGEDEVTVTASGSFESPDVNVNDEGSVIGRTVNISYELGGKDADNYSIDPDSSQMKTAATIHRKDLAIGGVNTEEVYDGEEHGGAIATVDDDVEVEIKYGESEDSCTLPVSPSYKNVGTHFIYFQITSKNNNYNSTGGMVFVNIHPRPLVVTGITAENKVYDGKKTATLNTDDMEIENILEGEDVTVSVSGAFDTATAGKGKNINLSYRLSGENAGNYCIDEEESQLKTTADITEEKTPAAKVSGILLAKMTAKGSKGVTLTWTKIEGAEGYDIFFVRCGKGAASKVKTVNGNKTFKWTKSGLKKKTSYKAYVKAYVKKNGKKTYVRTSPSVHVYTTDGTKNYTNPKSVTVKKTGVSLKKGKTYKIEAKVNKLKNGKKLIPTEHEPKLRYISSNKKIATVSKAGKITAKAKGTCNVYVLAVNGARKTVKVTVK